MADKINRNVTSVEGDVGDCIYKRISLEYSNSWPGQVYLRFEPFGNEAASIMIRVMPGDIVNVYQLGGPYLTEPDKLDIRRDILHELAVMDPGERAKLLSHYRHPSGQ